MKTNNFIPQMEPWFDIEERRALDAYMSQGGWVTEFRKTKEFETLIAEYTGAKHCIVVNNGTISLTLAAMACGIEAGDEVIIPNYTMIATPNSIKMVGAKPVFVDVEPETLCLDIDAVKDAISSKTKGIMLVSANGRYPMSGISSFEKLCDESNIVLIEDSAQSLGSTFKNKHTGTFFEMGCYSMYPAKVMTAGEGGFIVTNSKKLRDKLLMIRNHGMVKGYDTRILGLNLRLPEINAAIAKIQMKKLPKFLQARKKNAELLTELLSKSNLSLPIQRKHEKVNWYLYTVTSPKRNTLLKKLNEKGVGAASYYPIPVHKTPFYKSKTKLPITEWAASKVLSLPIHPKVTTKNIEFISKSIFEIL